MGLSSGVTSNFGPPCKEIIRAPLPNDIGPCLRTEAPLVRRRDRDAESLEGGRVWGEGTSPADEGVGGALQAPSAGSGAELRPKTGFGAFGASVLLRNFHWATLHSLPSPHFSPPFCFPYLTFPPCLSPSPTHSLAPFPFLPRSSP